MLFRVLFLTIVAIALPWPTSAEPRIALVIGNSAYPSGPLSSPKDDAKAIEAKLEIVGFHVTRKTDLGREGFFNAIRDFADNLQLGTVGLFYYSGHGMQVNNRNYMIPTDADIRSEVDVERYAVPVEHVLARMRQSKPSIIILDACRNNPFEKRFKSSQDGLARMVAPKGTLIAFAAEPGKVSEAGLGGKLSLYTETLVAHIDQPYPDFIYMFKAVQNAVDARSGGEQSPTLELWPNLPDFSFKSVVAPSPTSLATVPPPGADRPLAGDPLDGVQWYRCEGTEGDIDNMMCGIASTLQHMTEDLERARRELQRADERLVQLQLQRASPARRSAPISTTSVEANDSELQQAYQESQRAAQSVRELTLKQTALSMWIEQIKTSAHESRKHHFSSIKN